MLTYRAPLDEYRFVLHELFDYDGTVASLPGYEDGTSDIADAVIEEGAKFCENELLPLNQSGDEEGCTFDNGEVTTPKGFKEAYVAFAGAGWPGLAAATEYGGQGLPKTLQVLLDELVCSTNLSFGIYPGLSHGAYNAIDLHGTEAQKSLYLPKIADGTWSGTMCLTEPQCGTDLGLIRTKAVPREDDSYDITGTKIFISAGEHDLTENIIHLVLARLPDAPPGMKGISLFIVPKFLPNGTSGPGPRNAVVCGAIEHKMGIKASSTCVMNFDDATGFLIGEKHKGMRCMFTMMNAARLAVGIQGLGLAETAYQSAVAYARDRIQGRSLKGAKHPDKPADPIIVHPDVRRTLMTVRACNEAARALAIWLAMELDTAERHPDADKRQEADDLVALMTPVVKAYFTDHGFAATNAAVQIHGGHGYIREHGVEQLVRDARIAQLYEGTNGIQALDLVGRKMPLHAGRLLRRFFHPVSKFIEDNMEDADLGEFVMPLAKAFARLQQATAFVAQSGLKDAEEAGAAASDYLRFFALVALGYMWARMAKEAMARNNDGANGAFYDAKLATARFYMKRVLPETSSLNAAIMAGAESVMAMHEDWF
jgi:alkylation response protein AidB-like acyl-CoA dehydrogenase